MVRMKARMLRPSAIETRIRLLNGMLRRIMNGIGYEAKNTSRKAK
jgi:hypothetical protein